MRIDCIIAIHRLPRTIIRAFDLVEAAGMGAVSTLELEGMTHRGFLENRYLIILHP